jgi:hypothetical protein
MNNAYIIVVELHAPLVENPFLTISLHTFYFCLIFLLLLSSVSSAGRSRLKIQIEHCHCQCSDNGNRVWLYCCHMIMSYNAHQSCTTTRRRRRQHHRRAHLSLCGQSPSVLVDLRGCLRRPLLAPILPVQVGLLFCGSSPSPILLQGPASYQRLLLVFLTLQMLFSTLQFQSKYHFDCYLIYYLSGTKNLQI